MKKNSILIALALFSAGGTWAEELPKDTLKVIDVEEIVVIAAPKENRKLREQPTAVTMLSQQDMQANQVNSIKSLTALVPNIFIPDYGSKLTSAIYIRGIGSRINTPSVGLYVDNVLTSTNQLSTSTMPTLNASTCCAVRREPSMDATPWED